MEFPCRFSAWKFRIIRPDIEWSRCIRVVLCTIRSLQRIPTHLPCYLVQRAYFTFHLIAWKSVDDITITSFKLWMVNKLTSVAPECSSSTARLPPSRSHPMLKIEKQKYYYFFSFWSLAFLQVVYASASLPSSSTLKLPSGSRFIFFHVISLLVLFSFFLSIVICTSTMELEVNRRKKLNEKTY